MRKVILALLFLTSAASCLAESFRVPDELKENSYSNVCECLEYAVSNETAGSYVEAVRGYTAAISTLTPMAASLAKKKEKTEKERDHVRKLNRLLSSWRYKLEELAPQAQLEAYETLRSDFNLRALYVKEALKKTSPIIIQTNLYNYLAAYKRVVKQEQNVSLPHAAPGEVDSLYAEAQNRLSLLVAERALRNGLEKKYAALLGSLSATTNLEKHLEFITETLEGKASGVTPAGLSYTYGLLTDELPLCYTYWQAAAELKLRTGDTNAALIVWQKALTRFPNDFNLNYLCARFSPHDRKGALEAVEYFKNCLELCEGLASARVCLEMAERYLEAGEYGDAYAASQDSAKIALLFDSVGATDYRKARLFAADLAARYGIYDAALENLERLASEQGTDIALAERIAMVRYSISLQKPGDGELMRDAIRAFDKVLAFEAGKPGVAAAKAVLYLSSGYWKEASLQAARELSIDPKNPAALTVLGYLDLRDGKLETAKNFFEDALKNDPTYQKAKEGLAQINNR